MDPQTAMLTALVASPFMHMAFGALVGMFIQWAIAYDPDVKTVAVKVDSYALALKAMDEKLMAAVPGSPVLAEADALLGEIDAFCVKAGIHGDPDTVTVASLLADLATIKGKLATIATPPAQS